VTRPWKDVYCERLSVERNWRRGRCTVRTLKGHTDGVMCLQFSEALPHPTYPILMTGSYDRTARIWNLETGQEVQCLRGHTRTIRALQFDEFKLITASMDHTIRVWDWWRGKCICTLEGHTAGVVSLNFDSNVLASGSVDMTVKVWNVRTREAFTLRGHSDWVNAVQLWDSNPGRASSSSAPEFDLLPSDPSSPPTNATPQIDPGKMLFSASDDGSIRLWDLTLRTCVRQFNGHVAQVQSMRLLVVDECSNNGTNGSPQNLTLGVPLTSSDSALASLAPNPLGYESLAIPPPTSPNDRVPVLTRQPSPILISGSLDNTIKLWDIDTGKAMKTLFGHIEGVWAVASDRLRLVSGSHDRTIKACLFSVPLFEWYSTYMPNHIGLEP
jgi:F-box/WD-40 domain protein MET30